MKPIITYLFSFLWGLGILFSLIGWGGIVNRLFSPNHRPDWGQKGACGMAFSLFIGGILNVTRTISQPAVLSYLAIGLLYWLYDVYKNKRSILNSFSDQIQRNAKSRALLFGILIVSTMIFLRYANSVSNIRLNEHDDGKTYIYFPVKMLQQGSLGEDPFNNCRMLTGLGGQSFLHTFVLVALAERNLSIIDAGIGLILSVGLLLGYLKKKKATVKETILIIILFLLVPPPRVNISSVMTGVALFLGLFRIFDCDELRSNHYILNACMIALIISAICALKPTFIPACAIIFFLSYFFYIRGLREKSKAVYEFIFSFIFSFLFLLPWMISMYQSSGTLLYPIFGKGYLFMAIPTESLSIRMVIDTLHSLLSPVSEYQLYSLILPFILISVASLGSKEWEKMSREPSLSFMVGTAITIVLVPLVVRNTFFRYSFSFLLPTIFILIIDVFCRNNFNIKFKLSNQTSKFIAMIAIGMIIQSIHYTYSNNVHYGSACTKRMYITCAKNLILGSVLEPFVSDEERKRYITMQQSIPKGETLLAVWVHKTFLFDFRRNNILLFHAGLVGTSLPPGIPYYKGSKLFSDYLISKSIRYVAYTYAQEKRNYNYLLKPNVDLHNNIKELAPGRIIYDDGSTFILDLLHHSI